MRRLSPRSLLSTVLLDPLVALLVALLFALLTACGGGDGSDPAAEAAANEAAAKQAHMAYLAAINSHNRAQFTAVLAGDIVYLPPNSPALVGKAAVTEFGRGYCDAFTTAWTKTSLECIVKDDLAYERYSHRSVDTPRAGGPAAGTPVVTDTGSGINIYRRGADGKWRLSRDGWATDRAPGG